MTSLSGLLLLDGELVPGRLSFERGVITGIEREEGPEPEGAPVIAPGLVDLHVHGFGGADPLGGLTDMARALARAGTTAFQPTLFPAAPERLGALAARLDAARSLLPAGVARAVGIHLEGPFVNPRAAGALPVEDLAEPSPRALEAILGPAMGSGRGVRTITLAPELAGSQDLVRELAHGGIRVSLGHSLATAAEARAAVQAGAQGATHLYNAMRPFHHREVGLAGVALTEEVVFAELIADLVHVCGPAIELALAARGPRGLCIVSDALAGAGTGCRRFHSFGREHIERDGAFYWPPAAPGEAPRLAGSACSQLEMVRRLVRAGVCSLAEALTMASTSPARALGIEGCGRLYPGARADLIVLDADLEPIEVRVGGVLV